MRHDRLLRPAHRKQRVTAKPSHAGAENPFHDYFVMPHDSKGISHKISFGAPPGFQRTAAVILQLKTLPFETPTDLFRWTVYYGLAELVKRAHDKNVTSEYSNLQSMVAIAAKEAEALDYERHLIGTLKTVKRLAENGHVGKATELADFVWRNSDRIEDPYWRRHYRTISKKALDRIKKGEYELKRRASDVDEIDELEAEVVAREAKIRLHGRSKKITKPDPDEDEE